MDIRRLDLDDGAAVAAAVDVVNAVRRADTPFEHPRTVEEWVLARRLGWDGEAPEPYAAWQGDRLVGLLAVHTSEWDNRHLAWLELEVDPEHRGRGLGSTLLEFGERRARELGRTSIGVDGWDLPHVRSFAAAHDLPARGVSVKRRQTLAEVDRADLDAAYAEALSAASDYELLRIEGETPEDLLPAVAAMAASINDAPIDDLDIEDEVYPPERVRDYERTQLARNKRLYKVLARHRATGDLAGHTVVAVEAGQPWVADQHDTTVVSAHRGHRLGLLLKADMLRWLAEAEPQVETIDTWNMESNAFMIGVNERLGYRPLGRALEFQRDVR